MLEAMSPSTVWVTGLVPGSASVRTTLPAAVPVDVNDGAVTVATFVIVKALDANVKVGSIAPTSHAQVCPAPPPHVVVPVRLAGTKDQVPVSGDTAPLNVTTMTPDPKRATPDAPAPAVPRVRPA